MLLKDICESAARSFGDETLWVKRPDASVQVKQAPGLDNK